MRLIIGLVASARGAAAGGAGLLSAPRTRDTPLVKAVPSNNKDADRSWRACSAAHVDFLGSSEERRKAQLYASATDRIVECRRVIDLHGSRAAGFILSSGEADADVSCEPHRSIPAARTGLASHAQAAIEVVVTDSRLKEVGDDMAALRGDVVSVDITWARVVRLFGSIKPKTGVWRSNRLVSQPVSGRWGVCTGVLAYADAERAAKQFGPLLVDVLVDVGGGPTPADVTCGLLPLVEATSSMVD